MDAITQGLLWGVGVGFVLCLALARRSRRKPAPSPAPEADSFPDMAPCRFFDWLDDKEPKLRAVGWVAKNSPYRRGKSDPEAFEKLLVLLASPWCPACLPRRMDCPFCPIINPDHGKKQQPWWVVQKGEADGIELIETRTAEAMAHVETYRLSKSGLFRLFHSSSLFVPADGLIFVAHPMIGHFVDKHGYDPPPEFWNAIKQCAEMRSIPYLQALIDNGPRNKSWLAAIWADQQGWDLTPPTDAKT